MRNGLLLASAVALMMTAPGCRKDDAAAGGLPPAADWEAPDEGKAAPEVEAPAAASAAVAAANPHPNLSDDPHAGMGADPHAGMGVDPHADMPDDPHAGLGMKLPSSADHGAPGGDPSRPVDESKFLGGTITASAELAKRIKPGSVIFLSVHRYDAKAEGPVGSALATDKLDSTAFPASFRLTGRNAMGGGGFDGDVVISAWTDQDRDAISKQPGDIIGRVRATVPAEGIELKLDTVLE